MGRLLLGGGGGGGGGAEIEKKKQSLEQAGSYIFRHMGGQNSVSIKMSPLLGDEAPKPHITHTFSVSILSDLQNP